MIDLKLLKRQQAEQKNLMIAMATGKDKKGLTFRPMALTESTRTRGSKDSRRRTARVWEPITVTVDDGTDDS